MKNLLLLICSLLSSFIFCQDKVQLKSGITLFGKIKQMDDTLVVINARYKDNFMDYFLKRADIAILKIDDVKSSQDKKVIVVLKSGKIFEGTLIGESKVEYIFKDLKEEFNIDILYVDKNKVKEIRGLSNKKVYYDIGFLRGGGALIGLDLEFVSGKTSTIYLAGGFRGFGAGINLFFSPDHRGYGVKLGFNNQGFGDYHVGRTIANTFFYKPQKGITIDIGIAKVLGGYNSTYNTSNFLLWYGLGYRF